jgi:hypothetical protein
VKTACAPVDIPAGAARDEQLEREARNLAEHDRVARTAVWAKEIDSAEFRAAGGGASALAVLADQKWRDAPRGGDWIVADCLGLSTDREHFQSTLAQVRVDQAALVARLDQIIAELKRAGSPADNELSVRLAQRAPEEMRLLTLERVRAHVAQQPNYGTTPVRPEVIADGLIRRQDAMTGRVVWRLPQPASSASRQQRAVLLSTIQP